MAQGNTRMARQLIWFAAFVNVVLLCILPCSVSNNGAAAIWIFLLAAVVDSSIEYYALKQGLLFELYQERTWKAVCDGLGFTVVMSTWGVGVGVPKRRQKLLYPRLRNVQGTREAWIGTVIPFAGQTVKDYNDQMEAFSLAFQVPFVSFELAGGGCITIRAGNVPIPDPYNFIGPGNTPVMDVAELPTQSLQALLPAPDLRLLQAVPMARDLSGHIWSMPIEGQHLLITGRTGAGKGSWIWSLVLGLAPAIRSGHAVLWGCDPKRLELAIGRDWWTHYAYSEAGIVEMLEACVKEMLERAEQLQGKVRKFTPSRETPLNVIVVDELGYLSAMLPDKKLRDRAEKAISTILALGRAVGFSLVGAVQDPRVNSIPFRDLFPIRIAGALPAPIVDLVLGDGAHDAGATCEQIPLGAAGAGVAYVISETSLKPICVRAAWCDDQAIRQALVDGN